MWGDSVEAKNAPYATSSDFCKIFQADMDRLYLLSLLLTATAELAERCFVEGLQDARNGNRVFKEWAHAWSRRMIIKNAIRALGPSPDAAAEVRESVELDIFSDVPQIRALFTLPVFERFVFVVTALEGYSDRECALLFGSTRQAVAAARIRALQVTGDPNRMRNELEKVAAEKPVGLERPYQISPEIFAVSA
jgi:DNA-directed RNA polymerase specialized sigma24 family protein